MPEPEETPPSPVKIGETVEVPYPPPPARVEFVPEKPRSGTVWVDGEWSWTGRRWSWTYGRWVDPPPEATFTRWRTVRTADGALLFVPGAWHDEKGAELADPPPIARGRAREENVTTPPGEQEKTAPNRNRTPTNPAPAPANP